MSTTDTTRTDDTSASTGPDSVWGAPPPAADYSPPTVDRPMPARRWLPDMVKTKVAALLAAAGLVVGGAAGVAVGHSTGSGTQLPAGQNGQLGPGGQGFPGGQGGPGGQSGTTQQGTVPGTTQQGTVPGTTT